MKKRLFALRELLSAPISLGALLVYLVAGSVIAWVMFRVAFYFHFG